MISKKVFTGDGVNKRFLSDFIISSEQFARPYVYVFDNTLDPNGTEDVLQNPSNPWSFPTNLYRRGTDAPQSEFDLLTIDKWDLVDNSILTYEIPLTDTHIWIEVATTPEEFGETLTAPSVERAETAAAEALASANNASASEVQTGLDVVITNADVVITNADVVSTNADKASVDARLDTVQANSNTVEQNLDLVSSDPVATQLADAEDNATKAELEAWEAEAEKLTADSYASEPEDVFVKIYTSNGNGTFSVVNAVTYSSLHYSLKSSGTPSVDTIVDLIASQTSISTINVRGYYLPNDGGGGLFNYDATQSAVNNGGTIIDGWVRQYSGAVNILWFGAKRDDLLGSASINDASILAALNTLEDVYAPKGKYHISKTLFIKEGQEFYGDGKDSFFNMAVADQGGIIHMVGTTGVPVTDCYVHSLGFDANLVSNLNVIGVAFAERTQTRNIWGFNVGRKGYTAQLEVKNNICSDCYFDGGESSRALITLEATSDILRDCTGNIVSNITIGVATDWVVALENADECIITNITAEQSLRGVLMNTSHNNKLDNIHTNATNTLMQMAGCNGNDIDGVTTEQTLTNTIHNFVTSMSSDNVFRNMKAVSSSNGVPLGILLQTSQFISCEYETDTSDTITGGAASNKIKFSGCKLTGTTRVVNSDTTALELLHNEIYTTNVGVQINNTTPKLIGNNLYGASGNTFFMNGCTDSILVGNSFDTGSAPSLGTTPKEAANSWN